MKTRYLVIFSFVFLSQCAYFLGDTSGGREAKTPKQLYAECMTTFQDDAKCKEFVLKSIPDADVTILGQNANPTVDPSSLKIRADLIKSLLYQNKIYVKEMIGEPDEKRTINNWAPGMEEWVYTRPITKYAEGSRPDRELRLHFQKGTVVRVLHTPPSAAR
ncbi:hypothetical protein EHQ53_17990 [Leptospira langatensis]|uniref:Lipoprotein n=1 Tax=Leptospira langatensis TaxID=2484983 RepID=A0A5F1ZQU8_9LEPT|nr:hypothetical protein [Leptospira langatensis]TGK05517.1 hypothetical protein EHO57_02230 [Leptospira langatensis]TGL38653.1 hypothetical protein EHQ53_17990 [Leptospira langatensis]